MLFRNASAHASITVTDNRITATQREIRAGRVVSSRSEKLNDDEFIEGSVSLHEVLLALQPAILPRITGHTDRNLAAAMGYNTSIGSGGSGGSAATRVTVLPTPERWRPYWSSTNPRVSTDGWGRPWPGPSDAQRADEA